MKKTILQFVLGMSGLCFVTSCAYMPDVGKLLPDKKTEYQKSESMPDLEIPPDLTADAINDSMNIPDEAAATLSRYRNPRGPGQARVTTGTTETEEQWLSVSSPIDRLWPALLEYFEVKNYPMELEDEELGVLETGWSQADEQTGLLYRYKYKIFAEQGDSPDVTILIISQQRQTRLDENADWLDQDKDPMLERQFISDLGLYIDAGEPAERPAPVIASEDAAGSVTGAGSSRELRVVDAGQGKMYLTIPESFEQAWKNTGVALRNSGLQVTGGDAAKGLYMFTGGAAQRGEKKGFISKLAFWKDKEPVQTSYRISLTGVGSKTELIVVNEDDQWETTDDAARILALIRDRYPVN